MSGRSWTAALRKDLGEGVDVEKDPEGHRKDQQWIFSLLRQASVPEVNQNNCQNNTQKKSMFR